MQRPFPAATPLRIPSLPAPYPFLGRGGSPTHHLVPSENGHSRFPPGPAVSAWLIHSSSDQQRRRHYHRHRSQAPRRILFPCGPALGGSTLPGSSTSPKSPQPLVGRRRRNPDPGAHPQRPRQPSLRRHPGGDRPNVANRPTLHAHPGTLVPRTRTPRALCRKCSSWGNSTESGCCPESASVSYRQCGFGISRLTCEHANSDSSGRADQVEETARRPDSLTDTFCRLLSHPRPAAPPP